MELAFLNIGGSEMMLIIIVILVLFGGKKLPEIARGLGRGIREFKDASEGIKREISDQINNFENELNVEVEEETKPKLIAEKTEITETENSEKKEEPSSQHPLFTPATGTYQHNPGIDGGPQDEYYRYGYDDHFAGESETVQEDNQIEDNLQNKNVSDADPNENNQSTEGK